MPFLDSGSAPKFFEKSHIRSINASQLLLDRLAWQCFPMRVCGAFQIRQMLTHYRVVRIRQSVFISLTLPLMEVFMHLPHVVKQVPKAYQIRLTAKFIFIRLHGISSIKSLTPVKWVGPTHNQAIVLNLSVQLDTINYTIIWTDCQIFCGFTRKALD